MRVVIDVNVWVSVFLWGGVPGQILKLVQQGTIASYISDELLLELKTTLDRPKFQTQLQKRNQIPDHLCAIAQQISNRVELSEISIPQLRDQNDVKILATAIVAEAQVLITGDLDLLVLNPFGSVEIISPIDFQTNYCG